MARASDMTAPDTLKIVKRPSALEAIKLEDVEAADTLADAIALEMTPRERDGHVERLSLWGFSDEHERDRTIASFVSRRSKKQTVVVLLFSRTLLVEADVSHEFDVDPHAPQCVQHLHLSADFGEDSKRHAFAEVLLSRRAQGQWSHKQGYIRITKGSINACIEKALEGCEHDTVDTLLSGAPSWFAASRKTQAS